MKNSIIKTRKGKRSYKLENQFYADDIDFSKWNYPKVRVQAWRTIVGGIGELGSINVQADENKKLKHLWLTIKEYPVYDVDDQEKIRAKAQATARRLKV